MTDITITAADKDALLQEFGDDSESRERWKGASHEFVAEYLSAAHRMGWRKGLTFTEAVQAAFDRKETP